MTNRPQRAPLPSPDDDEQTDPGFAPVAIRRVQVPWGLITVLGVYALLVFLYATLSTQRSPDYQAAKHFVAAREILGADGCAKCSRAELTEAYGHLLEAARLEPQVATLHRLLESLNWRFDRHHWKLPGDFKERAEAVAVLYARIQKSNKPILVVGARDMGWDPDQWVDRPKLVAKWAVIGALGMVVLWVAMRWKEGLRRAMARHANLSEIEEEIAESERQKRRG
jgi:hypothetical protein